MQLRESIETFLVHELARTLELDPNQIDVSEPLANFALDSIAALELVGLLEAHLGRPVSSTIFFDYPTIACVAEQLASSRGG